LKTDAPSKDVLALNISISRFLRVSSGAVQQM